jgi:hypothetical protein
MPPADEDSGWRCSGCLQERHRTFAPGFERRPPRIPFALIQPVRPRCRRSCAMRLELVARQIAMDPATGRSADAVSRELTPGYAQAYPAASPHKGGKV